MKWSWYNFYNVYSEDQCKVLYDKLSSNVNNSYKDRPALGKNVSTSLIETEVIQDDLKLFFNNVKHANEEYFGFRLFDKPQTVNLNEYDAQNNEYPYHRDGLEFGSASDIKLTAVLNISTESFTGGDFEIFDSKDVIIKEIAVTGNMLVFPSFMYHRVKPVISGKRVTISAWFTGPNWR
jgi:PKHD-type hydroxylase